jgi:hypothetical protein
VVFYTLIWGRWKSPSRSCVLSLALFSEIVVHPHFHLPLQSYVDYFFILSLRPPLPCIAHPFGKIPDILASVMGVGKWLNGAEPSYWVKLRRMWIRYSRAGRLSGFRNPILSCMPRALPPRRSVADERPNGAHQQPYGAEVEGSRILWWRCGMRHAGQIVICY